MWARDIEQGRSHGCRSKSCRLQFEACEVARTALESWAFGNPGAHPLDALGDQPEQREAISTLIAASIQVICREKARAALVAYER